MKYRKIDPRIWNDSKFASLSHEAQRLFLFVLTHPSMTMLGAMRATRSGMAEELGLTPKAFAEAFGEALSKGLLMYDERGFLVFAKNFLKYNQPESPNVVKAWAEALDLLPECPLKNEVILTAKSFVFNRSKAFQEALPEAFLEALPQALPKGMANQEQEQEQEQEERERKEKERKPAPGVALFSFESLPDEWRDLCTRVRPDLDPEKVFASFRFYWTQGNGRNTRRKPESWARTWSNWIAKERERDRPASFGDSMTQGQRDRMPTQNPNLLTDLYGNRNPSWLHAGEENGNE